MLLLQTKMEEDRPGSPAPDDNMKEEEVPSTSGIQEQTSCGDEDIVIVVNSESSSEEEEERLPDPPPQPPRKGKKRKRRRNDDASGTAPSQPAGSTAVELRALEEFGGLHPQTLGKLIHTVGATSLVSTHRLVA